MDRGAPRAVVHGVTKSWVWLSMPQGPSKECQLSALLKVWLAELQSSGGVNPQTAEIL